MIGALFNGLSGLDTFQKALNTQSNNVSNVNTIGYKSDGVTFADMMYQDGVGKGAGVLSVQKNFEQGELKITGNPYDVAIMGDSFLVIDSGVNDEYGYTRAGNLRMGKSGTLQTSNLKEVLGSATNVANNQVVTTDENYQMFTPSFTQFLVTQNIQSDTGIRSINAKATDIYTSATNDPASMSGNGYKSSGIKIADAELLSREYSEALEEYASNPNADSVASQVQIDSVSFDTTGMQEADYLRVFVDDQYITQYYEESPEQTLNSLADKISALSGKSASVDTATGELTITGLVPGETYSVNSASVNDTIMTTTNVQEAVKGSGEAGIVAYQDALKAAVENAGGKFLQVTNGFDFLTGEDLPDTLQSIQLKLDDLSLSANPYADIEIASDGIITMNQDGSKFAVGKIELAKFVDNLELEPEGGNIYKETEDSGKPRRAMYNTEVVQKSVEMSNSNLATGLTDLMIYQRAFEANAKSLTTSDEFLNIALQLKK